MANEGKTQYTAPGYLEGETLLTIPLGVRELILTRDATRRRCTSIYAKFVSDDGDNFRYAARARTDEALKLADAIKAAAERGGGQDAAIARAVRESKTGGPQPKGGSPVASLHHPGVPTDGKRTAPSLRRLSN